MRFVEDFLNGQEFDDAFGAFVERSALVVGVLGVTEADEEPPLSAPFPFALNHRLKCVFADLIGPNESFPYAVTGFGARKFCGRMQRLSLFCRRRTSTRPQQEAFLPCPWFYTCDQIRGCGGGEP
jgi:hypothetical protein